MGHPKQNRDDPSDDLARTLAAAGDTKQDEGTA